MSRSARRASSWLALLVLVGLPASATAAPPLLRDSEARQLRQLFAQYFRAKRAENYKEIVDSFGALRKKLTSLAKAKKIPDLLASVEDMRAVFGAPPEPEKRVKKGILVERKAEFTLPGGEVMVVDYLLHLPRSYRHENPTPTVLALHPPLDRLDQVRKWFQAAYPKDVLDQAMVVVPLNHEKKLDWSTMEGRQLAFFSVNDAYVHFYVDRRHFVIEGHGPSCSGVVEFATTYPSLLTAVSLRNPDAALPTERLGNARYVPMLLVAPPGAEAASAFLQVAQQAGVDARLLEDADVSGGRLSAQGAGEVAQFVTGTEKTFAPTRIVFEVPSLYHTNAYWFHLSDPLLEIDPQKPIRVEAEVDRSKNEFHVRTPPGLREFTIYVNDELVDMGKPIRVVHTVEKGESSESHVRFEGTKSRNLEFALRQWFDVLSGNFGEVYTNQIKIELAEE